MNDMTPESFDQTLRELTRRQPFRPFAVELNNGERIVIETPGVAFGGGAAGFVSEEEGLVGFAWNEVWAFHPDAHEVAP